MHNFKQAIKTTLCFLLSICVVSIALIELYFNTCNYYYQDGAVRESLSGSINYVISGASHGMRAFQTEVIDSELEVNSYNLCSSRMTMKGRYDILLEELNRNPVDTVVLEVSYDTMSRDRKPEGPEGDIYVLGRLDSVGKRLSFFFSTFYLSEWPRMYYDTISRGCFAIIAAINGQFKTSNDSLVKGYYPYAEPDQGVPALTSELVDSEAFDETVYDYNKEYMEKVLELCEEKEVNVIMVTTPLSEYTIGRCTNLDAFYKYYQKMAEEHGITYYDLNLLKNKEELFQDDVSFYDEAHLNNTGAAVFSAEFTRICNRKFNDDEWNELFYSSYAEKKNQEEISNE